MSLSLEEFLRRFLLPPAPQEPFKELEAIPQFKATAKLGEFLQARFSQSFLAERRTRFASASD